MKGLPRPSRAEPSLVTVMVYGNRVPRWRCVTLLHFSWGELLAIVTGQNDLDNAMVHLRDRPQSRHT